MVLLRPFLALLLLTASFAPAALGHGARGVTDGVSGTYYGAAGLVLPSFRFGSQTASTSFMDTNAQMECDLEVLGDGTSPQEPDETDVDGIDYTAGPNSVPDGLFDDGGHGGACHTNHYDHAPYNTPGCRSDGARADSVNPAVVPWVGAACDWKTVEGGIPQAAIVASCLVNGILDGIDDQPGEAIACILDPLSCPLCVPTETCGSDGVADGINYGRGDTRVPYPNSGGTDSFTGDGLGCTSMHATMEVFIFVGVTGTTTAAAVQGSIWQVA